MSVCLSPSVSTYVTDVTGVDIGGVGGGGFFHGCVSVRPGLSTYQWVGPSRSVNLCNGCNGRRHIQESEHMHVHLAQSPNYRRPKVNPIILVNDQDGERRRISGRQRRGPIEGWRWTCEHARGTAHTSQSAERQYRGRFLLRRSNRSRQDRWQSAREHN